MQQEQWSSLLEAVEPHIEKPLRELPEALQRRVADEFHPFAWDELNAYQRGSAALQHDNFHNPEWFAEYEYWFELKGAMQAVEADIDEWTMHKPQSITERDVKERRLAELRARLGRLKAFEDKPPFSVADWETLADAFAPEGASTERDAPQTDRPKM